MADGNGIGEAKAGMEIGKRERVALTICGVQRADGEENCIETRYTGTCMEKDFFLYLLYEEPEEDSGAVVKWMVRCRDGYLERIRKTKPEFRMIFEERKVRETDYPTPFGILRLGIRTGQVSCRKEKEGYSIEMSYCLEREGELLSDCELSIRIERLEPKR